MGSWGAGPFENDGAADFLGDMEGSPSRVTKRALRVVTKTQAGAYIDVDDGSAAWAACELVALSFGYDDGAPPSDNVAALADALKPTDDLRRVALAVLPRIADRKHSELAALWHEGADGGELDAAIGGLRTRLEAAAAGQRRPAQRRAKAGDVLALVAEPAGTGLLALQVVGADEVAVFDGRCADKSEVLAAVKTRAARRVPVHLRKLLAASEVAGTLPVRKDLKGKKLYARELGDPRCGHGLFQDPWAGSRRKSTFEDGWPIALGPLAEPQGNKTYAGVALALVVLVWTAKALEARCFVVQAFECVVESAFVDPIK